MTPMKSQGFSHRKGKEIASDPPAVPNVGEEAEHSESEQSVGEETQHAPRIDPWYKVHPHFLKVPGDHVLSPPGRVWLALVWRNPDVS